MSNPRRVWAVAALSFLFTYLFFFEYQPHFKRVHIPYDLHGYHYSLADYTFQALRAGRFPQWDPTIYCGLSFPGNTNAALFYPPTWIALAANLGRRVLSYQTMEDLVFAHVWLAFLLCYLWLRNKRLLELASLLGAAVFAFSGYVCQQLQHLGLIACYAWMPLGFWGIDESIEQRRWRPLWKVAAASSMCFLAGYVPTWFVFAVCLLAYSAWRWRALAGAVAALGASMVISMVQLLPSYYATALKYPEAKYGSGIQDPAYLVSYLLPNYFDFSIHAAGQRFDQYLYLGIPFLLGLPFAFRRWRELIPVCLMGSVVLVIATNPGGLVWGIVRHFSLLNQICRDWYFLAGLTLAAAPVAAIGLDSALRRKRRLRPAWLAGAVICVLLGWSLWQLERWFAGTLPTGCRSGVEMLVLLALSALAVYLLPAQKGRMGLCLAAALLMAVGVDYKVYGTSKRVNAAEGQAYPLLAPNSFYAMDDEVFGQIRRHPEYRVALDVTAPIPEDLRHYGMTTPQGFDPFLPRQYKSLMETVARFRTDREIALDPADTGTLRMLGVRYYITSALGRYYGQLLKDRQFRLLEPSGSFYKVFELQMPDLPYRWSAGEGSVRQVSDFPEHRVFDVSPAAEARFILVEQNFPGWEASVDGVGVPIEPWRGTFQSVRVPAGAHRLEFRYQAPGLRAGGLTSGLALLFCAVVALWWTAKPGTAWRV